MTVKISQLPAASTITGTEIAPVVQSSVTKQASVNSILGVAVRTLENITALRALAVTMSTYANQVSVRYNWFANDGGGMFQYDSADTTSVDNGGTIIVSANGARWKRMYDENTVNVIWFGAKGDNTQNDTTYIQAALNTGKSVLIPKSLTCRVEAQLNISGNDRVFNCQGTLNPIGAIDLLVANACNNCEFIVNVSSSAQTAGYALTVANSSRCKISINADDCFGVLNLYGNNDILIESIWASCRGPGIRWYGDNTYRSDILTINKAVIDPGATFYGFDWDGNCHTLNVEYLGLVCGTGLGSQTSYGVIIRNTSGHINIPAIGRFDQVEVDYPLGDGIDIIAGLDFDFVETYVNGAVGDGIQIGAAINDYEVRINGGKFVGCGGYGINAQGGVVLFGCATALYSNTLGETTGDVWAVSPRFAVDDEAYLTIVGDDVLLGTDTNDYMGYNRTNDKFVFFVASNNKLEINAAFTQNFVPHALPVYTVATLPTGQVAGARAIVSDGSSPVFTSVVAGAGATPTPVYFDGTNWRCG